MSGRRNARPSQSERIAAWLSRRAEPVSSRLLAIEFLAMSIDSESLATTLVGPMMEAAGARYVEDAGWRLEESGRVTGPLQTMVAAAVDSVSGQVALAVPAGGPVGSLEGATVVMMSPGREQGVLRAWIVRQGLTPPASVTSLRGAIRRLAGMGQEPRIPRDADLAGFCGLLGVRWLDTGDAPGAARAIAACLSATAARSAESGPVSVDEPSRELPAGITREMLASLPRGPGVYRFYDDSGALLYAGKARDLRQRVSSYFHAGAARRPRRFYANIHRLDYTLAGTELDALLAEARLIARKLPPGNVQVQVHERPVSHAASRACVLLLPRPDRRGVTAIVVRDGRCLGRVALGPRGGGLGAARKWIALAICPRPGSPAAGARAAADSEILRSWLARQDESVCRLDLDGFRKADAAMKALREAVADTLTSGGAEPVVYR